MMAKIKMVLFVLILGTILSSALISVNTYTAPIIERNQAIQLQKTILSAFGYSYDLETLDSTFNDNVTIIGEGETLYYRSSNNLLAFPYEGKGFQGEITGVIAIESDMKTISGLAILSQIETPGLGSRIGEEPFLSQFVAKQFDPQLKFMSAGKSKNNNEIDGISGATLSSKAIINILNDNYVIFNKIIEGE
ncbi:MAG: FMN-binding protein [Spirochaetaceae bacterium]|jgi:RnfABCDGE-type electron transport complex G subunit|nr:FMN-binding protein [Spirochaetaceae bacterium]